MMGRRWLRGCAALIATLGAAARAPATGHASALFRQASFVATNAASAEPQALAATLQCPRRPGPGRVLCEAELEISEGQLVWADVLVLEAPPFARPLRTRAGSSAVVMQHERRVRIQLSLAATELGEGRLRVRGRAVRCLDGHRESPHRCAPLSAEAVALVHVGPIGTAERVGPR